MQKINPGNFLDASYKAGNVNPESKTTPQSKIPDSIEQVFKNLQSFHLQSSTPSHLSETKSEIKLSSNACKSSSSTSSSSSSASQFPQAILSSSKLRTASQNDKTSTDDNKSFWFSLEEDLEELKSSSDANSSPSPSFQPSPQPILSLSNPAQASDTDVVKNLKTLLSEYNATYYKEYKTEDTQHFILTKVSENDQLIVIPDIHGNLDVIDQVKKLIQIDENYQIKDKNIFCIFLGDYVDKGPNDKKPESAKVLIELLKFKRANPKNVLLTKGNHEDLDINIFSNRPDNTFRYMLLGDNNLQGLLRTFYSKLPLAHIINCGNESIMFSHAGIEVDVDLKRLFTSRSNSLSIPFSQEYDSNKIARNPNTQNAKTITSAQKIEKFIKDTKILINKREPNCSNFNWSDTYQGQQQQNKMVRRRPSNNPLLAIRFNQYRSERHPGVLRIPSDIVKDYFRLISTEAIKVKYMIVAHQHEDRYFSYTSAKNHKRNLITVLGIDSLLVIAMKPQIKNCLIERHSTDTHEKKIYKPLYIMQ